MKLSTRGEYAMKAMHYLAMNHGRVVRLQEIAEAEFIPLKYLEQILLILKNTGLVASKRGLKGGYYLAKEPEDITFGAVIRTVDGPLAPISCASQTAYERCPQERGCDIRNVWLDIREAIANILDNKNFGEFRKEKKYHRIIV